MNKVLKTVETEGVLRTELFTKDKPEVTEDTVVARLRYVPLHGSFWLASHPDRIHPRADEFLADGSFIFGNGGVLEAVEVGDSIRDVRVGDLLCVYGHLPCDHYDCYACTVLHRYTECDYGENRILGHGKGAPDGTYALYCRMPRTCFEICYKRDEHPAEKDIKPFMYGFLFADVRNALTRHPDTLRNRRMLVFGAGQSGLIASYLHTFSCPGSSIVVVDPCADRLERVRSIAPDSIRTYQLAPELAAALATKGRAYEGRELDEAIKGIEAEMIDLFRGRKCNVLFDGSSGCTSPLWDNDRILSPTAHCIPFGFGSSEIILDAKLMQASGLSVMMSRGVGNLRNRREVIELIKFGGSRFIQDYLIDGSVPLAGLEEAARFICSQQDPPKDLHQIPHAHIALAEGDA